jgi:antitoxin HicB
MNQSPHGETMTASLGMHYKIPLLFTPQPEGGYTVTCPLLPEFLTEGDSLDEALEHARDALATTIELYEDLGRTLPSQVRIGHDNSPVWLETVVSSP